MVPTHLTMIYLTSYLLPNSDYEVNWNWARFARSEDINYFRTEWVPITFELILDRFLSRFEGWEWMANHHRLFCQWLAIKLDANSIRKRNGCSLHCRWMTMTEYSLNRYRSQCLCLCDVHVLDCAFPFVQKQRFLSFSTFFCLSIFIMSPFNAMRVICTAVIHVLYRLNSPNWSPDELPRGEVEQRIDRRLTPWAERIGSDRIGVITNIPMAPLCDVHLLDYVLLCVSEIWDALKLNIRMLSFWAYQAAVHCHAFKINAVSNFNWNTVFLQKWFSERMSQSKLLSTLCQTAKHQIRSFPVDSDLFDFTPNPRHYAIHRLMASRWCRHRICYQTSTMAMGWTGGQKGWRHLGWSRCVNRTESGWCNLRESYSLRSCWSWPTATEWKNGGGTHWSSRSQSSYSPKRMLIIWPLKWVDLFTAVTVTVTVLSPNAAAATAPTLFLRVRSFWDSM